MAQTCVYFYLEAVSYYVSKDIPVFSAFLDASKAFDRTNHNLLFAKLIQRNVPVCIVRRLLSWYRKQTMQVNNNYPSCFTVTNGIRQGGVLSPYLCAVYLDEVSDQLGSARVGWTVGNMVVNHLIFADNNVCSAQVLVGCNVFWVFAMTMLLNMKSLLIATKQLVFFLAQKSINTCAIKCFSKWCTCTIFWPSGVWINASLKDDDDIQRQVKSLHCAANRGTFDQCSPAVKNTVLFLLHANVCLPIVEKIHTG